MENDVHLIHLKRLGFKVRKSLNTYFIEISQMDESYEVSEEDIETFIDGIHAGLYLIAKQYGIKEKKEEK